MTENLWIASIKSFWSDPTNIIGPPGALVRRMMKALWLALSFYVLFWVAGPSQVASWQLWMADDKLARDIGWAFTLASALCFAIVGYRASESDPIRVPIFLPKFEGSWRNLRIHSTHVHIPNLTVGLGGLLAASLFSIALLGQWNYYLHDGQTTGGASVAAIGGSTERVDTARNALAAFEARTARADEAVTAAIIATSAGSPTGRSRLVAQQSAAAAVAATERERLTAELNAAQTATVDAHTNFTDPRPVDAQVASVFNAPRATVASLLDLMRSGVVEALLMLGAGLGLAVATSKVGVPKPIDLPAEPEAPVENVAETPPAPEAPVEAPPPRRFVLPVATDADYAAAVVVGPHAPPEQAAPTIEPETAAPLETPSEAADEPAAETPQEAPTEEIDPLAAAAAMKDAA